jgi:hypothetical protein
LSVIIGCSRQARQRFSSASFGGRT